MHLPRRVLARGRRALHVSPRVLVEASATETFNLLPSHLPTMPFKWVGIVSIVGWRQMPGSVLSTMSPLMAGAPYHYGQSNYQQPYRQFPDVFDLSGAFQAVP